MKRIITAFLIGVTVAFGHPHEKEIALSDVTLEVIRENKLQTKLLVKEANAEITLPKSWGLSSPTLVIPQKDQIELDRIARARYGAPNNQRWALPFGVAQKTEKRIRMSSVAATERIDTELTPHIDDFACVQIDLQVIPNHLASELSVTKLNEVKEGIQSELQTVSPGVFETKMNGIDTWVFMESETNSYEGNVTSLTHYWYQIGENVLYLVSWRQSNITEKLYSDMTSLPRRIRIANKTGDDNSE